MDAAMQWVDAARNNVSLNSDAFRALPELAHNCRISSSRLSHLFKDEIGINVKHYRLDCRLQTAAESLVSTNRPMKEIAYSAD